MNISELLDRPIAYHRVFVTLTGSVKAAILLSQATYWQKRAKQADGWWYKSAEEWEEETGLSRREQETARRDCGKYLMTDLRGVPATLYWKVNEQELTNALIQFGGNVKTGLDESAKQDSTKTLNINKNTETTTENTTTPSALSSDIQEIKEQANKKVDSYLLLMNSPGLKTEARIDAILSYLGGTLRINTETKRWRTFAKFVDNRQREYGEKVDRFVSWLVSQKDFNIAYWSPQRMQEYYPQAFAKEEVIEYTRLL